METTNIPAQTHTGPRIVFLRPGSGHGGSLPPQTPELHCRQDRIAATTSGRPSGPVFRIVRLSSLPAYLSQLRSCQVQTSSEQTPPTSCKELPRLVRTMDDMIPPSPTLCGVDKLRRDIEQELMDLEQGVGNGHINLLPEDFDDTIEEASVLKELQQSVGASEYFSSAGGIEGCEVPCVPEVSEEVELVATPSPPSTPSPAAALPTPIQPAPGCSMLNGELRVAHEKQEEVVKAARSLFSKRTRTLYHWLFPHTSKAKLKATVLAAWETLPDNEKHFYISQVLGRFGLQASSLMINPQLDGIQSLSPNLLKPSTEQRAGGGGGASEEQAAVDQLFASCDDAGSWASYPHTKRKRKRGRPYDRRRPRRHDGNDEDDSGDELEVLRKLHEHRVEFEDDSELCNELDKLRDITANRSHFVGGDDDDDNEFWRRNTEEDLFSQIDM